MQRGKIEVEFPPLRDMTPSKGSAVLPTQVGGCATTVSAIQTSSEAIGNGSFVNKDIG